MEPLLAYLHYLSIILLGAFLTAELVVCRPPLAAAQIRQLPRLDIVFFGAAMLALATGLLRLFFYAKGVAFYLPNPAFITKMLLYVAIGWRRALDAGGAAPDASAVGRVRRLLHLELAMLALMPLMAVLMARGLGR